VFVPMEMLLKSTFSTPSVLGERGTMRAHEGRMQVESAVGKGSTFRTCFPGVDRRVEVKEMSPVLSNKPDTGVVLVVDDEPSLRALAKIILEKCGYTVLIARDGKEVLEMFRQHVIPLPRFYWT
jgi:hypothetical protein